MKTKQLFVGTLASLAIAGAVLPTSTEAFGGFGNFFGKNNADNSQTEQQVKGVKGMFGERGEMMDEKCAEHMPFIQGLRKMEISEEMQSLMDQLREAQKSKDTEKVTALREQMKTARESEQAARRTAMSTAITGTYEAWKAFMTEQGAPEELFKKITADNFSTFQELHATREKVRELEEKLGVQGVEMPRMMKKGGR